jgi:hypothetical protein
MAVQVFYSIVKFLPDPAREETTNIGVIVAHADRVLLRFLDTFARVRRLYPFVDEERLLRMEPSWRRWIAEEIEKSNQSAEDALRGLSGSLAFQTQVTEPRRVEVASETLNDVELADLRDELFDRLVRPPEYRVPRRPKDKTRVRTLMNRQFRQLGLLERRIYQDQWIDGTSPHLVTYLYKNGREVAIDAVDVHFPTEKAERSRLVDATYGKWADIKKEHGDRYELVTLLHYLKTPDFERSVRLLASLSRVFVVPEDTNKIVDKVKSDFAGELPPVLKRHDPS